MITVQCTAKSCENQCIQTDFVWGFLPASKPAKIIVCLSRQSRRAKMAIGLVQTNGPSGTVIFPWY